MGESQNNYAESKKSDQKKKKSTYYAIPFI